MIDARHFMHTIYSVTRAASSGDPPTSAGCGACPPEIGAPTAPCGELAPLASSAAAASAGAAVDVRRVREGLPRVQRDRNGARARSQALPRLQNKQGDARACFKASRGGKGIGMGPVLASEPSPGCKTSRATLALVSRPPAGAKDGDIRITHNLLR